MFEITYMIHSQRRKSMINSNCRNIIENLYRGLLYVDNEMRITYWNKNARNNIDKMFINKIIIKMRVIVYTI